MMERRVNPVLDNEVAGLDFAGAANVEVLGDGLLAVPAKAALL